MEIDKNKKLLNNAVSLGAVEIVNYVLPLFALPIVTRIIGPEKFGVINFIYGIVTYFFLIITYGFNLTATRKLAREPDNSAKRNRVFSEVVYAQGILFIISTIIFSVCLLYIPQLRNEWLVSVFTFLICINALLTQDWLFQAMQDLSKIAILNLISKLIFIILVILTIHKESDYIWYAFASSISIVVVSIISFIWSIKRYRLQLYKISFISSIRLIWAEKDYFFTLVILNVYTTTNVIVLGFLKNASDVGYYTAANKITIVLQSIIILPLRQALFPFMTKELGTDKSRGLIFTQKLLPLLFWPTFIISITTCIFSNSIITFLYGNSFKPSVVVLQILSFIPVILVFSTVCGSSIMMSLNLDKVFFRITTLSAILSLILNIAFINVYGYVGCAIAWILTESFKLALVLFHLQRVKFNIIKLSYFSLFKVREALRYVQGLVMLGYRNRS